LSAHACRLTSRVLVILNHWLWFRHFSSPPKSSVASSYYGTDFHSNLPTFTEIASFFFLQVWLVPFSLFVSLSASENVLPSMGSEYATDPTSPLGSAKSSEGRSTGAMGNVGGFLSPRSAGGDGSGVGGQGGLGYDSDRKKRGAKGMVRVAVDSVREWVSETGEVMGLWTGERTRRW
jgi:Transmembrane adaptor Erv26